MRPPYIPGRLLEMFCPPQLLEGIAGDLEEQFYADVDTVGPRRARLRYAWNIVRFFHLEILLRNKFSGRKNKTIMVGNYFIVGMRNIRKRGLYSFINTFGLSVGIAFCMLISLFILDEMSFDRQHANLENLYRIDAMSYKLLRPDLPERERWGGQVWLQLGLKEAVENEIPEVAYATRFNPGYRALISYGDRIFTEHICYVDRDFFKMFSFKLLQGDKERIFIDRRELVLTPEIAMKYFGNDDPIGKTMRLDTQGTPVLYTVTGIIEAPPANSSFDFKILLPQENRRDYVEEMASWDTNSTPLFVQLHETADRAGFKAKLNAVRDKYYGANLVAQRQEFGLEPGKKIYEYVPTPLTEMHLKSSIEWDKVSDKQHSYILGGIATLILLIACINYVSLALTTSAARRTEVGIRKVVGAVRKQIFYQFGFESIILVIISLVLGFGLMILFLPSFNSFTGKLIHLTGSSIGSLSVVGFVLALVVGIASGAYPAIFLSRFKPVTVLRGRQVNKMQAGFTKPLVVFQFAMSAFLIISSLVMYRQMKFVSTKDLGYQKDAVVVVPLLAGRVKASDDAYLKYRNDIEKIPGVASVAGTSQYFGEGYNSVGYRIKGVQHSSYTYTIDHSYLGTMGIKLVSGRNFDVNMSSDSNAIIVNEALMRDMGWNDIDDAYLNWNGESTTLGSKVIGVVKDFHFQSLEKPIRSLFFMLPNKDDHVTRTLIRVSTTDIPQLIVQLESSWRALFPHKPFEYSFLDENIAKQYDRYNKRMSIMGASTLFAIIISCLGLFGLAGINSVNRTKEIGIRKVMGADIRSIFLLLNRQYVWLSLISFGLAIPFSWYVMDKWLKGFEFRISMGWELFALSMVAGLLVALLTVSYHAVRVALVNPAETLKYE